MDDHGHSHDIGGGSQKKALLIVLLFTGAFMFIEAAAGYYTGSLALLSDAGHMLTDVVALIIAFMAVWVTSRPPTARKTFGFYRAEILAAFINGLLLFGISVWIIIEAFHRLKTPEPVKSLDMTIVAVAGLLLNLGSAYVLYKFRSDNLNIKAAMYHVISDALGSVGAIAAGLVMIFTSWYYADSIISIFISVLILKGAWTLIRDSSHILLEGTPSRIDIDAVEKSICSHDGVISVHDLHAWTLTQGHEALSAHLVVSDMQSGEALMGEIKSLLLEKFRISHVTLQIETEECDEAGSPCYGSSDAGKA